MPALRFLASAVMAAIPLLVAGGARAERPIERSVVFIECTDTAGGASRGSGVIVSPQGHVLTAKHVVPDGAKCKGSIGVADPNVASMLVVQPTALPVDAALLRFTSGGPYDYVPYCNVEDWMIRKRIIVAGFPGNTETGAASYREGVLATTIPNASGLLETDGQTVEGMSGGPVFSRNLNGLIGIVAGAKFTAQGTISYYGILPVSFFADALRLQESDRACYTPSREVDFRDEQGNWTAQWMTGDDPLPLGVTVDDGFCFIQQINGVFTDELDDVGVIINDFGEYELYGAGPSKHGATARCVLHE